MTSQEKDRFIAEGLIPGFVWHTDPERTDYPGYTSEAGRVQLLKLIKTDDLESLTLVGLIGYMRNDKGLFRDEVFRWLGGVE